MSDQFLNENRALKKQLSQYSLGSNPYIDDAILRGGYKVVRTIKERDAIDCCHKKVGMKVMVVGQDLSFKEFILKGDGKCSNGYWEEISEVDTHIEDSEVIITENTEFATIDDTQKIFNRNLSDAVQNGLSVLNTVITGEVTVNTTKVFLALHSSGFNKAYINGSVYKRTVAQEFNYIFPTFGKKFLVVYAVADSTVFYLAEGLESLQPIQPFFEGVPVTLLLVDINGAVEYQGDINKANTDGTNLIKIANWRDTLDVYDKAEVNDKFVNNFSETITTLEECYLQGNVLMIRYKGENGNIQNRSIDLSGLATIDIHINDASYNTSTNILTLTDSEGNTYSVDLSEFSIITNTDVNGITTLTQEAVIKLIVSKVGQTGDYNDLLNKPTIPAPVDISGKLDKPTADGTWVVTKSGSTISYTDASTLGQNISNANLTWTVDRTQDLGTHKLSFTNGRFSIPTLEMEVTTANSVPNKVWTDGVDVNYTNNAGINNKVITNRIANVDRTGNGAYSKVMVIHPTTKETVVRDFADPANTTLAVQNANNAQKTAMRTALLGTATPASPTISGANPSLIKKSEDTYIDLYGLNLTLLDPSFIYIKYPNSENRINALQFYNITSTAVKTLWNLPPDLPDGVYPIYIQNGVTVQGLSQGYLYVSNNQLTPVSILANQWVKKIGLKADGSQGVQIGTGNTINVATDYSIRLGNSTVDAVDGRVAFKSPNILPTGQNDIWSVEIFMMYSGAGLGGNLSNSFPLFGVTPTTTEFFNIPEDLDFSQQIYSLVDRVGQSHGFAVGSWLLLSTNIQNLRLIIEKPVGDKVYMKLISDATSAILYRNSLGITPNISYAIFMNAQSGQYGGLWWRGQISVKKLI